VQDVLRPERSAACRVQATIESNRSVLYHCGGEGQPMPDDDDDQHIVLKFEPGRKAAQEAKRKRPSSLQADPQDIIASGAVVAALVFAVAMVSGWIPFGLYTIGIVAFCVALAVGAKLLKARRSKASASNFPRQPR
jgi:hypothetical protein